MEIALSAAFLIGLLIVVLYDAKEVPMIQFLKRLLTDETKFVGLLRGLAVAVGMAQATGQLDAVIGEWPKWAGIMVAGLGAFVRSTSAQKPD